MGRNNLVGAWGEALAAKYLRKKHYKILGMNYRSKFGELDIIAMNKEFLVFVEVKLRKTASFASAYEYVDFHKQAKLKTTAELYLAENPTTLRSRFDVVEIYAPDGVETAKPEIHHIEEAFE